MIAAAIAAFGFVSPASAQKDAAEKAKEGGIKHWIEYYKAEQRKFPADAGGRACRSRRARRSDWARHVTAGKTKLKKDAFTAEDAEEGESKKYSIAKKLVSVVIASLVLLVTPARFSSLQGFLRVLCGESVWVSAPLDRRPYPGTPS